LILGGTQFVGRHIVEALLDGGHTVSILNRGQSPDELPSQVERLRGDRDQGVNGLKCLAGRSWDVCVDVSGYTARQVRASAEELHNRVNRYVFISAVAVYGDPVDRPVHEAHARVLPAAADVTEVEGEMYARLKVTCENIIQEVYAGRGTILRPQIVAGPYDPSGRFAYWVRRAALGGEMLAPGDGSDHLQFIDARDVARFTRIIAENDLGGAFNLAGPRVTWAEFMRILRATNLVWVPAGILQSAGVTEFELPLFRPERGPRSGLMEVSNEKARKSGLMVTDPGITVGDVRTWMREKEPPAMLASEREMSLIRAARR
jgi:2'-hydroxyisoflavone reductase